MDFDWSETQATLYTRALGFARERLSRTLRTKDSADTFPRAAWSSCGEFGLLGLSAPVELGGMGLDALTTAHVLEAFGLGCDDMGVWFGAAAHLFACVMPLVEHADDAFKAQVLPALCSGRWVGANAITEADAGSDVFALSTSARRDGDGYILDGTKSFVTNGPVADLFLVYAVTNKAHGYMGVSAFAVTKDAPGLKMGAPFKKIGLGSATIGSLYLDGCRVPATQLLGAEGQGAVIFRASMAWERAC